MSISISTKGGLSISSSSRSAKIAGWVGFIILCALFALEEYYPSLQIVGHSLAIISLVIAVKMIGALYRSSEKDDETRVREYGEVYVLMTVQKELFRALHDPLYALDMSMFVEVEPSAHPILQDIRTLVENALSSPEERIDFLEQALEKVDLRRQWYGLLAGTGSPEEESSEEEDFEA